MKKSHIIKSPQICEKNKDPKTFREIVLNPLAETWRTTKTSDWFMLLAASILVVVGIRAAQFAGFVTGGTAGISILVYDIWELEMNLSYMINILLLGLAIYVRKAQTFIVRSTITIVLLILWLSMVPPIQIPNTLLFHMVGFVTIFTTAIFAITKIISSLDDESSSSVTICSRFFDIFVLTVMPVALILQFGEEKTHSLTTVGVLGLGIGVPIGMINCCGARLVDNNRSAKLFDSGSASGGTDSAASALAVASKGKISAMAWMKLIDAIILGCVFVLTFITLGSLQQAIERTAFSLLMVILYGTIADAVIDLRTISMRKKIYSSTVITQQGTNERATKRSPQKILSHYMAILVPPTYVSRISNYVKCIKVIHFNYRVYCRKPLYTRRMCM